MEIIVHVIVLNEVIFSKLYSETHGSALAYSNTWTILVSYIVWDTW